MNMGARRRNVRMRPGVKEPTPSWFLPSPLPRGRLTAFGGTAGIIILLVLALMTTGLNFVLITNTNINLHDLPMHSNKTKQVIHDGGSNFSLPKFKNKPVKGTKAWLVSLVDGPIDKSFTVCVPAKAGSTSFYKTLYKIIHGKEWNFKGSSWVGALDNSTKWTKIKATRQIKWTNFTQHHPPRSIALIRDPQNRILSSWKDKIQCGHRTHNPKENRDRVFGLLNLADLPSHLAQEYTDRKNNTGPCLDLSSFLYALFQVHSQGKDGRLDVHFRPQHLSCFLHAQPSRWDIISTIAAPGLACQLTTIVGTSNITQDECSLDMKHVHATGHISTYANLTKEDKAMLDAITQEEYDLLAPYL